MGIEAALISLGASAAVAAALTPVIQWVAVAAISGFMAKKASAVDPGLEGRSVTKRGTVEPQQLIYGETLVAGTLAFLNTSGGKNSHLWGVHVLAGHEVESITDIWLDQRVITNAQINSGAAAGGAVGSGDFGPKRGNTVARINKHLGTSTQTVDTDLSGTFSGWTSSHRLRGLAYLVTEFVLWDRSEALWQSAEPTNVRALVKGKKIYDPRLDSTRVIDSSTSPETMGSGAHRVDNAATWAWSDNPALCSADFLMDSDFSPFPSGIDPNRIDWEAVAKAADVCDVLVVIPPAASPENTEKRYTCNGVIFGTVSAEDSLVQLLGSMNGSMAFSGGKYVITAGDWVAAVDTLDEDDIIGPLGIRTALDSEERVNTIKATYIDPELGYEATETAEISVAAYVTRDNGDSLVDEIQLPFTDSWYMAQRICLKRLYEGDRQITVSAPCNLRAARLAPGERINLNVTERGWTPKTFRVVDWGMFERGGDQIGVNVTLREDDSGAYADPIVSDYNTRSSTGSLNVADPVEIPAVDTIPRGIQYGEGSISVQFRKNVGSTGSGAVGQIQAKAGSFFLPDGTVRTLSADAAIYTPYLAGVQPPDGTFYVVWGAANPDTRFGAANYGTSGAEGAGLFIAVYDRLQDDWYAVDNVGTETLFNPLSTDYVVGRGGKVSAAASPDPGIDYFSAVPSRIAAKASEGIYAEDNSLLGDIDIRNDQLVTEALSAFNANASFQVPRMGTTGQPAPASWFGFNSSVDPLQYEDGDVRDVLFFPANTDLRAVNTAFYIANDSNTYKVVLLAKYGSASAQLRISIHESSDDLASGERACYAFVYSGSVADPSEIIHTNGSPETVSEKLLSSPLLTANYKVYTYTYTPTAGTKWASILLAPATDNSVSPQSKGSVMVEWCLVERN